LELEDIMAKTTTTTTTKAAAKPTPAPVVVGPNRYQRAAAIILQHGLGAEIDLDELAVRCGFSNATAGYCLAAYQGITAALRDAKMLPARKMARNTEAPVSAPKVPISVTNGSKTGAKQAVTAENGVEVAGEGPVVAENGRLVAREVAEPEPAVA
jgi:hypothetical protein